MKDNKNAEKYCNKALEYCPNNFNALGVHIMLMLEEGNERDLKGESEWYPDWQQRLLRIDYPRIHAVRYVHEVIVGVRKSIYVQNDIHHFNTYWKPKLGFNWNEMLLFYEKLKLQQTIESGSNIWPDEELMEE